MIIFIKENNGKIATFLTEWDLLFDILLYIFSHLQFQSFPLVKCNPFLNNPPDLHPYMFWI